MGIKRWGAKVISTWGKGSSVRPKPKDQFRHPATPKSTLARKLRGIVVNNIVKNR